MDFDFAAGRLSLKGESYPEDASAVFGPIFSALETFFAATEGREVTFDFDMAYFNSSSAKALMNMFQMLDQAAASGCRLTVNWFFAADDDTMKEFGEDFSEDLDHVTFNLVAVE
ncbi:Fe-S oxidoreductase [Paramagnetospirillum magnetotacticum MS-1]|uniref:Fe-S oxidoreductase n=1 Tax=Paramagnetospirillum magnetotacticum MS-1 TaxID=272627 RepID=A0A0C2V4F0_PARME|nr:Fe-S oxidoreductase [Paramagnetospirillum magnetotacticum MS-1]